MSSEGQDLIELQISNQKDSSHTKWERCVFGSVVTLSSDFLNPKTHNTDAVPCIELEHIASDTGRLIGSTITSNVASQKRVFRKGDILFGKLRPYLRKYARPSTDGVCSSEIWVLRPKNEQVSTEFLFYLVQSNDFINCANTSAGTKMPRADWGLVASWPFYLPPLFEQKKISKILECWDKALELVETIIVEKSALRDGLMQQLLAGLRRFGASSPLPKFRKGTFGSYPAEWTMRKLSSFLTPIERPVPKPTAPYRRLGLRNRGQGTFITIAEPEKIAMDTLYEVAPNELIVNITFAWEGSITITKDSDAGALVSHRFPTFQFREDVMIGDYFKYLSMTPRFVYHLGLVSPGGAGRNRVLSKRDFLNIEIPVPPIKEQRKIASLLCSADTEIEVLRNYLSELKAQKRGIMQQLLTGKKRVKV